VDIKHAKALSNEEYEKRKQHQAVGGLRNYSDSDASEAVEAEQEDHHRGCRESALGKIFCCCVCCKKTTFDLRVNSEVRKAVLAVKSRKQELEQTVKLLKKRFDGGDVSSSVPLESAKARLEMFQRDWHLGRGRDRGLKAKVKEKVREDLMLADAIELEFEDLDKEMKEVRLLEYARMMKLSKIERKIYFQNRLIFESELPPVQRFKKWAGWGIIGLYCATTGYYICMFGVQKGAQTCNTWLLSFILSCVQDALLIAPLKIMFMNVYLPSLISKRLKSINDPSAAENFVFSAFMPENAAIYVAMNHPELEASTLVLSRGKKSQEEANEAISERKENAGKKRGGFGLTRMNTGLAASKVKALKMYTSKGCVKLGLCTFAWFVLMPEFVQESLFDIIVPTAWGSFVYGNYQLYKLREWSPFTVNIALILVIVGTVTYFKHRRTKRRIMRHHKEHARRFRNSVVLELAQIQLQSKKGEPIRRGSIQAERRRLSVEEASMEEGGGRGGVGSATKSVASPLHTMKKEPVDVGGGEIVKKGKTVRL